MILPHLTSSIVDMQTQCDLGDGKGIQWYCRPCIESIDVDMEDWERDDSLIFCDTEWKRQEQTQNA